MRLLQLQDDGSFSLVEFQGSNVPPYAILSHTWGKSHEEITYQDLYSGKYKEKKGYCKLAFCGEQAAKDGLQYFWIDTCAIDKSSSAELSEAITSMFRWYQNSAKCYVYLSDVLIDKRKADYDSFSCTWESAFRTSRWFTRGWTLQELLAPPTVEFFSGEGKPLGDKASLEQQIHEITHIPLAILRGAPMHELGIEERMSWSHNRQTTREEDEVYSLLGLFNISMLPNYGEGKDNAFKRLRKEIMDDQKLSLREDQKQILLDSLRFDQIDARQATIKNAQPKTCKWLLKDSRYLDWLDASKRNEHHGFLWIKGKPGTGKSTLMKFALLNARRTMKDSNVLSFFFNARGEDIEKSTIGTFRSLLLQLLEQLPVLQSVFNLLYQSSGTFSTDYRWGVESLKILMEHAIRALGESSVVAFIDALDECEEEQIQDMVRFFEHIGELTVSNGIHFQVCFSSRHYPHITIEKGLELVLEGQEGHRQDITNYLESELKIGQSKRAQNIRSELQEKASGVFMWVALVVNILNKEHKRGRIHALQQRLREIPGDLHDLFRDILTRDSHNKDELVLCIQWVLFAKKPLSPEQLYFAILSVAEPEPVFRWNPDDLTQDDISRFILSASKGLAEITSSKLPRVQFIHESVRDFLLKEDGLGNIWPDLRSNLDGQSHERLKQCCLTYMRTDVFISLEIPESLPKDSKKVTELRNNATKAYPFLKYAVDNVLYHTNAAEGCGSSEAYFIHSFPFSRWITLRNFYEETEVRKYKKSVTLLYVLAELNLANLIKLYSSLEQCLEVEDERYGCPLFAAVVLGNTAAFQACMTGLKADEVVERSSYRLNEQNVNYELSRHVSRSWSYSEHRGLLSCAVELRNERLFAYLMNSGKFDIDLEDSNGRTPLWWASKTGCEAILQLLLSTGTININGKSKKGKTPLYIAVENGHNAVVELLLKKGADANMQSESWGNALLAASSTSDMSVVELLLENGADINMRSGIRDTALQAASAKGVKSVVVLLLDKGADINAQGGYYGNALQAASAKGDKSVVELLLDKGADVNAQGGTHGNALQAASAKGDKSVVELLLDKGANVNAQGGYYGNALSASLYNRRKAVKELLLDRGAIKRDN